MAAEELSNPNWSYKDSFSHTYYIQPLSLNICIKTSTFYQINDVFINKQEMRYFYIIGKSQTDQYLWDAKVHNINNFI